MVIKTGIGDQATKPYERPDGYIYPMKNVNKKEQKNASDTHIPSIYAVGHPAF
jgi:hypothetical protein